MVGAMQGAKIMVADFGFQRHFAPVSIDTAWDGAGPKRSLPIDSPDATVEERACAIIAERNYEHNEAVSTSMLDAVLDALL
jgi:hypothetical protein